MRTLISLDFQRVTLDRVCNSLAISLVIARNFQLFASDHIEAFPSVVFTTLPAFILCLIILILLITFIMLQAARRQWLPAPSLLQSFQTSYHLSIYAPRCSHATSCATLCSGIISTEVHRNRHNLLYYFIHPRVVININLFSILFPNNYLM